MGHAAQGEEYRFVEQGAGHDPLRGDDRLRCPGVAVQDLVGRREAGVGRFSLRVRKTAATIFDFGAHSSVRAVSR